MRCLKTAMMTGVMAAALSAPAFAESRLYQWTDAQGRVQFSDRAPASQPATAQALPAYQPELPPVRQFAPVALPAGRLAPLAVAEPDYSALQGLNDLGRLHVGGDCVNPTQIGWADITGGGSIFLEGNRRYLVDSAVRALDGLGYDVRAVLGRGEWESYAATGALRLVPVIERADIRVCVRRSSSQSIMREDRARLIQSAGDRAGVWLKVRWELWRQGARYPLKIFDTEGASLQWSRNSSLWLTAQEAMQASARNLAGYPGLGQALREQAMRASAASPASAATADVPADTGGLSGLMDKLSARYLLSAKVAQALSLASPLKLVVVEYYLENGRWPLDLAALLPPGTQLGEPGVVDKISLGADGQLIVSFSPKVRAGAWLKLTPRDNHINVQWTCTSNLPQDAFGAGSPCQGGRP